MKNKGVILLILIVVAVAIAMLIGLGGNSPRLRAVVGQPAPDFELSDLQGEKISLHDFRGKVVLVNFWATWCETCKQEAPGMQKIMNDRELVPGFMTLKILFRDSKSNAARYLKENNFTFKVLVDDRHASLDFGVTGVPESFIISKKGILRHKFIGPVSWDSPDVRSALKALISEE
jgi:cytochrome c biogenesis protein CcmG, thiol:disulfide interchange protein DsbE